LHSVNNLNVPINAGCLVGGIARVQSDTCVSNMGNVVAAQLGQTLVGQEAQVGQASGDMHRWAPVLGVTDPNARITAQDGR
jgi:hypothetical protein